VDVSCPLVKKRQSKRGREDRKGGEGAAQAAPSHLKRDGGDELWFNQRHRKCTSPMALLRRVRSRRIKKNNGEGKRELTQKAPLPLVEESESG